MSRHEPILVTGAARSGTSLVAGTIVSTGEVWIGDVPDGNDWNEKGYFENLVIRDDIVKPYLKRIGADPFAQDPLPKPEDIVILGNWRTEITRAINAQGYAGGPWLYKGAKMCLMWEQWTYAYPDAKWVLVYRDPEEIAKSCLATKFMRNIKTYEGWYSWALYHHRRMQELEEWCLENGKTCITVNTSRWDDDVVKSVIGRLGLTCNDAALQFYDADLWHHKVNTVEETVEGDVDKLDSEG